MTPGVGATPGSTGPLTGLRAVELGGIGPVPFAGMLLSDLGAEIVRVERPAAPLRPDAVSSRGKTHVAANLHDTRDSIAVRELIAHADIVLEGFRPGVAERLGLGPADVHKIKPQLVYGRVTGWGNDGPLAGAPGHDVNYIGMSGALSLVRDLDGRPVAPPGLVGDFGGAGALFAVGILAALRDAQLHGTGRIVEISIVAGSAALTAPLWEMHQRNDAAAIANLALQQGQAPFYGVFECSDERYVTVGAVEPEFYRELCRKLGLSGPLFADQFDVTCWPAARQAIAKVFRERTRTEWAEFFAGTQACVQPMLDLDEALCHPQNIANGLFLAIGEVQQPAPVPTISGYEPRVRPSEEAQLTDMLRNWTVQAQ
jgi:alpha-methylacyl-CoA racemase